MKNTYKTPKMEITTIQAQQLMAGSISNPYGIGYGGVDNGNKEPGSRYVNIIWEDDEEDEDW